MSENLSAFPDPPVPAGTDLTHFRYMPLDVQRLLQSDLWNQANASEFQISFALWIKSWHRIPAGSLPKCEKSLAKLVGISPKEWQKVRDKALHGWEEASDGLLYHRYISEVVLDAIKRTKAYDEEKDNQLRRQRLHRESRKRMTTFLRSKGVEFDWNITTSDLKELSKIHGFVESPVTHLSQ
jgi:uncharacterized protein YdaU (DUF1376 family)